MANTTDTVTRHVGFCAICEGDFKLRDGRLVHHGFKRPGVGYIIGDCLSVDYPPYEVSCEIVKEYRSGLARRRTSTQETLDLAESGKVTYLSHVQYSFEKRQEVLVEFALGVTPPYEFSRALESRIWNLKNEIRNLDREIERCDGWIQRWEPKPIRTIEEAAAAEQAVRDEKKAAREAARLAKVQKRAEIDRKAAERTAQREAITQEIVTTAHNLAERKLAGEDVSKETTKLAKRIRAQKWLWVYHLKIDETLIVLDLASRSDHEYVDYRVLYG